MKTEESQGLDLAVQNLFQCFWYTPEMVSKNHQFCWELNVKEYWKARMWADKNFLKICEMEKVLFSMVKEKSGICSDSLQPFQVRIFKNFSLFIKLLSTWKCPLKTHKQYFRSLGIKGLNCKRPFLGLYQTLNLDFRWKKKVILKITLITTIIIVFLEKKKNKLAHIYKCLHGKLSQWIWRKFSELSC